MKIFTKEKYTKDGLIFSDEIVTEKEAYEAMLHFLKLCIESTGSNVLTDILSGGEYFGRQGRPADTAYWEYWLESVEKLKKEGPPPLQEIH